MSARKLVAPALVLCAVLAAGAYVVGAAAEPHHGWSQPLAAPGAADASTPVPETPPTAAGAPAPDLAYGLSSSGEVTAVERGADRGDAASVSAPWASTVAAKTGIPQRAVTAYAGAALAELARDPGCHLGWTTLAALGAIESGHGRHGGSVLGYDGVVRPVILGPLLGPAQGDRAMGPLQFIPSTWSAWGADGSGDGLADPQNIDDASLTAARYLCSYGDLSSTQRWRTAVFAYNHLTSYVDDAAATANRYAGLAR